MQEEKKKSEEEIVILDEGIDVEELIGPESICCGSVYMPIRMW